MKAITLRTLQDKKSALEKFAVVAAYDACFAQALWSAGVEVILVGDSLGMVLQGHDSTLPVSIDDMAYHTSCVKRANTGALIIADMPFMSYATVETALTNAGKLMQAGAHMVKMEGGTFLCETIQRMVKVGIPVCAHLGLTPQSVNAIGGYRVQGRTTEQAEAIIRDALALEKAGAGLLVLECVPASLGKTISKACTIPVIGIGAGVDTDAQVLVLHDLLGLNPKPAKFVKDFMAGQSRITDALSAYRQAVIEGRFPGPEHSFA